MDAHRPNRRLTMVLIVANCLLLAVPVAAYAVGYLIDGEPQWVNGVRIRQRGAQWQCVIYGPIAQLEAKIAGYDVCLSCDGYPQHHYSPSVSDPSHDSVRSLH